MLRDLSLWDKRDDKIMTLSGGMKRRVIIAKALSHEPRILFLDEPTAGVDVELRREMWELVRSLRETGVTIILTTHYIVEAEEIADRIGVINNGEMILVEEKAEAMRKLQEEVTLQLDHRLAVPDRLAGLRSGTGRRRLRARLHLPRAGPTHRHHRAALGPPATGVKLRDLPDQQSSLEEIFVDLVKEKVELPRDTRDLRLRDGAHLPHDPAEHRNARYLDVPVLRRLRSGDRLAYHRHRRRQLRRLYRAGPDHAVAPHAEHLERVVRHLLPQVHGHDLRAPSAPVSYVEIVISYVGAAATKSIILGLIILATSGLFVPLEVQHPLWMFVFLVLTAVTFSLFGFLLGIWAEGFEKLQLVPFLIITPLIFLGGSFYSVDMLPPFWQTVTLFNPVVYLISGFRWSFYGNPM